MENIVVVLFACFILYTGGEFAHSVYNIEEGTKVSSLPENIVETKTFFDCANACRTSNSCAAASYLATEEKCYLSSSECESTEISIGWTYISVHRREYIYINNLKRTRSDAQAFCTSLGGQLARIFTSCENDYAVNLTPRNSSVWIDGTDSAKEGTWLHSDGSSMDLQIKFDYWGPDQPNNYNNQDCLALYYFPKADVFGWADEDCSNQYNFMCEK